LTSNSPNGWNRFSTDPLRGLTAVVELAVAVFDEGFPAAAFLGAGFFVGRLGPPLPVAAFFAGAGRAEAVFGAVLFATAFLAAAFGVAFRVGVFFAAAGLRFVGFVAMRSSADSEGSGDAAAQTHGSGASI
jgi:hypothetical protein